MRYEEALALTDFLMTEKANSGPSVQPEFPSFFLLSVFQVHPSQSIEVRSSGGECILM